MNSRFSRFLFCLSMIILSSASLSGQMPAAISIYPADATAYDTLTLTFDPAQACFQSGTLEGSQSVAMHSGVSFIDGTDWNNVVAFDAQGVNGQSTHLTDNGDGTYSITYLPADFYGFPGGSIVTQICVVFNNGNNWNNDGRDFNSAGTSCVDFFIPLNYNITVPTAIFRVNMNRQILDGNFDPGTGSVYVVIDNMDTYIMTNTLDSFNNQSNIYEFELTSNLTEGDTISYHFRMNGVDESLQRSMVISPGSNYAVHWFNDISLCSPTLSCDMNYYIDAGWFDPLIDYVDVAGTFNNWDGSFSLLSDLDGDGIYTIDLNGLDPGHIEFKFRINGSWDDQTAEFPNSGPNRVMFVPTGYYTYTGIYNNFNPNGVPVTFICNMQYQKQAGHFDPEDDYLEVSGSFNSWSNGYQLIYNSTDDVYNLTIPVDTIDGLNKEFIFWINGNWDGAEWKFLANHRLLQLQDTTGGNINIIDVWFNDDDPAIGSAPRALNPYISGEPTVGNTLNAAYEYEDVNGDPEGASTYLWATANDLSGNNWTTISDGPTSSYTVQESDQGKYIFLKIRPVAQSESGIDSTGTLYGDTVTAITGPVWFLGIESNGPSKCKIFPNPVQNDLNLIAEEEIESLSVFNVGGQLMFTKTINGKSAWLNFRNLKSGPYLIRINYKKGYPGKYAILKAE